MPNGARKLDLLKALTEKGRMAVDQDYAPLIRELLNDGLVERWGIPDMMIHQPTAKGRALIAEQTTPDETDDSKTGDSETET